MPLKLYVTLEREHIHHIPNIILDRDSIIVFDCKNKETGYKKIHYTFNGKYDRIFTKKYITKKFMQDFPRGLININSKVSQFGKFIRMYRYNNKESFFFMSTKLGIPNEKLKEYELGTIEVPDSLFIKLLKNYFFTDQEKKDLKKAFNNTLRSDYYHYDTNIWLTFKP